MMKTPMLALLLVALVACGGGAPEGDEAVQTEEASLTAADAHDLELPPEGSLPLSEILASIEVAGHTSITEVGLEDGVWEVEFVVGGEEYELEIDPVTGEALSEEPVRSVDD
jgi:hypothetical protein